jgi:hypothetical protein
VIFYKSTHRNVILAKETLTSPVSQQLLLSNNPKQRIEEYYRFFIDGSTILTSLQPLPEMNSQTAPLQMLD